MSDAYSCLTSTDREILTRALSDYSQHLYDQSCEGDEKEWAKIELREVEGLMRRLGLRL